MGGTDQVRLVFDPGPEGVHGAGNPLLQQRRIKDESKMCVCVEQCEGWVGQENRVVISECVSTRGAVRDSALGV